MVKGKSTETEKFRRYIFINGLRLGFALGAAVMTVVINLMWVFLK